MLFAAALAPVAVPHVARAMTGSAPDSPVFLDEYREQLRRVIDRLR